jgi:hypothetical protein
MIVAGKGGELGFVGNVVYRVVVVVVVTVARNCPKVSNAFVSFHRND